MHLQAIHHSYLEHLCRGMSLFGFSSQRIQQHETLINKLISIISRIPKGSAVSHFLYRLILCRMGENAFIQAGAEILGTARIAVGNNVSIFRNTQIQAESESSQIVIGDRVTIQHSTDIVAFENACIEIGEQTFINHHVWIHGVGSVRIGRECLIAPYVGIVAESRNYADPSCSIASQEKTYKGVVIEDDCWLGHRVSVLDGVTIGRGSVIGAGAVVTKDIPPYSIAVGVPAKVVGSRKPQSRVTEAQ